LSKQENVFISQLLTGRLIYILVHIMSAPNWPRAGVQRWGFRQTHRLLMDEGQVTIMNG